MPPCDVSNVHSVQLPHLGSYIPPTFAVVKHLPLLWNGRSAVGGQVLRTLVQDTVWVSRRLVATP
jgi:hypothetical protein